ncbi:MAG: 2-C-methyl-D-erythritol 2,4-cyclodiphosphate synthase [Eubacteriales bacterium]|nr:2-C-methyl-D-erythritol 2,4-cyclodiphosphate synthase [Eubacteriales bacterium]
MNIAIIVAAGKGTRMNMNLPKQMLPYRGSTVLQCAAEPFSRHDAIDELVIVMPADGSYMDFYRKTSQVLSDISGKAVHLVLGGKERGDSVQEGLRMCGKICKAKEIPESQVNVLIHDGARADVSLEIIDRNLKGLRESSAVCTAVPAVDSMRIVPDTVLNSLLIYPIMNSKVIERRKMFYVQTPQSFRLDVILESYEKAARDEYQGTDDASVAEYAGVPVAIVEGEYANRKITTKEDVSMEIRTGNGYDVHRLVPDRDLILCGTPVPSKLGLLGHSDADVATHAVMDALLGAAGKGDIGKYFPDTDEKYRGADSMTLLQEVMEIIGGYRVINVDVTIICEKPKLAPYIESMRNRLAEVLAVRPDQVNVKATTTEKLGFTGRGEGIAAIATCAIEGRE